MGKQNLQKNLSKVLTKIYFNKSVCAPLPRDQTSSPPCNLPFHICLPPPSGHDRSGVAASQGRIVSGLPSEHINLFVSPQLLFIRPAWYNPIYIV